MADTSTEIVKTKTKKYIARSFFLVKNQKKFNLFMNIIFGISIISGVASFIFSSFILFSLASGSSLILFGIYKFYKMYYYNERIDYYSIQNMPVVGIFEYSDIDETVAKKI